MIQNFFTQTFAANTRIFSEGESGTVAYVIESGQIEISVSGQGKQIVLGTLTQGELFGEMALIDDAPRTATATAVTDTTLTVVNREQLLERLDNAEPILYTLMRVIIARYRAGINQTRNANNTGPHQPVPPADNTLPSEPETLAIGKFKQENELRHALQNNELLIHYQPLLDIQTGLWAGFEALTRWNHPTKGAISPAEFIALAEETKLIIPIGLYVMRQACADMVKLQAERNKVLPDSPPLFISVNISPKQIAGEDIIGHIAGIITETKLPPTSLKLEITESMTVDYQLIVEWTRRCKSLGMTIAIDDFGTGYSSMEHLLEMDVDTLKIDQGLY